MYYGKKAELALLLDFYGELLSDRQKEIAEYSFDEDLSLREIASICGITYQGVRDSLKKSEEILRRTEEKLGLCRRFAETKERFSFIVSHLTEIKKTYPECSGEIDKVILAAKEMLD